VGGTRRHVMRLDLLDLEPQQCEAPLGHALHPVGPGGPRRCRVVAGPGAPRLVDHMLAVTIDRTRSVALAPLVPATSALARGALRIPGAGRVVGQERGSLAFLVRSAPAFPRQTVPVELARGSVRQSLRRGEPGRGQTGRRKRKCHNKRSHACSSCCPQRDRDDVSLIENTNPGVAPVASGGGERFWRGWMPARAAWPGLSFLSQAISCVSGES
jgi:hypothetical protein